MPLLKKVYRILLLALLCNVFLPSMTYAAPVTIAGFEMSGNTGNEVAVNATVNDVDLETATVTRGSGITATNLSNAFSANNFVIGGTKSDALTNNEYYEVSLQSKNGLSLSLDQITFNIRRSSTGPNAYQWQYSLDGFATPGVDIGAEGSYTDTATNGASMTPIDLTTEADLQKIPVGHTITFRLYAWGATGGPGTFAIGRQIGDDLAFVGTLGSGALASFEPQGLDGDEPSLAATTLSTDLNIALLDRGPGIGGSALNDGFSSNAYTIAGTKTDAINQGDYLQITLEAKDNYRASFSEILFNIRRSSTGPNAYQWQYSLDGFATPGVDIGAEGSYVGTETNGLTMPAVNLNVVPELQKAKDVTFRLYAWGATTGAGTFALARLSGDDLVFTGFVSPNNVLAFEQLGKSGNEITSIATTIDTHLQISEFSRGAGIVASALSDAYSATGFDAGHTMADAIANDEYIEFSLNSNTGWYANLDRIEFSLRRSGTGPNVYQWQYSNDYFATAGIPIGVPETYAGIENNGLQMPAVDLSSIPALQNTTGTTFRLYAWGATGGPGTFAIGRLAGNDLSLIGEVKTYQYTVQYLAGVGGSITGTSHQTINYGDATTQVIATPQLGFQFDSWSDANLINARNDSNVTSDHTYTAQFSPIILPPQQSYGGLGLFTPPPSIGRGEREVTIAMNSARDIGFIENTGVNTLFFIHSTATFTAPSKTTNKLIPSSVTLKYADLYRNHIRVQFKGLSDELTLAIGDTENIDLDGDGTPDIQATFVHVYVNRIELTLQPYNKSFVEVVAPETKPQPTKSTSYIFTRDLKTLSTGDDVQELQKYLNSQGFILVTTGPGSPGQETQKFGAATRNALIRYQEQNNIQPAIGYFGPITRGFINK